MVELEKCPCCKYYAFLRNAGSELHVLKNSMIKKECKGDDIMLELEKCPCCKEYGFLRNAGSEYLDIDLYFVQCHNPECRLRTPYGNKEEVIEIWNRRISNV